MGSLVFHLAHFLPAQVPSPLITKQKTKKKKKERKYVVHSASVEGNSLCPIKIQNVSNLSN